MYSVINFEKYIYKNMLINGKFYIKYYIFHLHFQNKINVT